MKARFLYPILTAKKHLPLAVRTRDILMTIVLWEAYIYFMKDLFVFLADVVRWGWHGFANAQDYKSFAILPTVVSYLGTMAILAVLYIGWARYNQIRFRGKSRRRRSVPVQVEDLARFYRVDAHHVESWQQAKILTIHHDKNGHIIKVD